MDTGKKKKSITTEPLPKVETIEKIDNANTAVETSPNMDLAPKTEWKTTSPFSDMLAPMRENIKQDKTDAVKMQKYYALTDALGALGKMGGTAIGGAIGGDMGDSASAVADYQPSRGYVNAFEKAKQANDRLRALDEMEFKLQVKDNDRKAAERIRKAEREIALKNEANRRKWEKDFFDYKVQAQKTISDEEFERESERRDREKDKAMQHDKDLLAIRAANDAADSARARDYAQFQHDLYADKDSIPFAFSDGTGMSIPKNYFEQMKKYYINKGKGDEYTIEGFLMNNPQLVRDYMNMFSKGATTYGVSSPERTGYSGYFFNGGLTDYKADAPNNYVEANPSSSPAPKKKEDNSGKVDLSQFERK